MREQTRAEDEHPGAKSERSFEASEAGARRGNARMREFWNARIRVTYLAFSANSLFRRITDLRGQSNIMAKRASDTICGHFHASYPWSPAKKVYPC